MAFDFTDTTLQALTGDADGSASVVDPDNFNVHRFLITSTDTVTLNIDASQDGADWYTLKTVNGIAATNLKTVASLDRPWQFIRVDWTNNGGNLTVKLTQLYDRTETTV